MTSLLNGLFRAACACLMTVAAAAVGGCSPDTGESAAAVDCSAQLRADGIVYTSHGYSDRQARKHASAEEADCRDTGSEAAGPVFPGSPHTVTTWSFSGYPPSKVLGVRFDQDSYAVFVADSVASKEREAIYEDLAAGAP